MAGELVLNAAVVIGRFPVGTKVQLFGVAGVPNGTTGTVDFVDDVGQLFIETPEGYKNACLSSRDEGVRLIKVCS